MRRRRARLSDISKTGTREPTRFEEKVYAAVMSIPAGEVRSYGWVARKIGSPAAFRAVGNALNRNPFIGKVPCHRVVRSDGSIGGFAKGFRRKVSMLRREGLTRIELIDIIKKTDAE
ncbi:MAG: MGMT family protein [Candidatus Omnitrophica bacterium]|nr:MGMT family protein [Candidatus Omnitrophota bacterium]